MSYQDGAACVRCGEDAVWMPTIVEGATFIERPLCGACTDNDTFLCVDCGSRHWNADARSVYERFDRCVSCASAKEDAFRRSWQQRQDEHRDDVNQVRR